MKTLQNLLLKQQLPRENPDSLGKVVLDNRIALDYFLPEQSGVCAMANTICCTWIDTSGEVETPLTLHHWISQLAYDSDSFNEIFLWLIWFWLDWVWAPWLWSTLQTLEIILLIIITVVSLAHCILSKVLNACLRPLTTKQMISLRLEHLRNKENKHKPESMTCEYPRGETKMSWPTDTTQRNNKNC